ncbi:MAG: hypothetical protein AB1714_13645 [Acidobacteriota bacterium]
MRSKKSRSRWSRAMAFFVCTTIVLCGLSATCRTWPFYTNYWGGLIYGPVAMAIGLLGLYIAVFRWEKSIEPRVDKRGRRVAWPGDESRW